MNKLLEALKNNHTETIELLLDTGHSPYEEDIRGEPFWLKVVRNPLKNKNYIIEKLINDGIDVNLLDKKGNSPLYTAIKQQNKELIEILVNHEAEITDSHIYICVVKNDLNTMNLLIRNLIKNKEYDLSKALTYACDANNYEIVNFLIEHGVDYDILMHSNQYFNVDNEYCNYGVNPQKHYKKAAFWFARWGTACWLKICLQNGVSVNATNQKGQSLLFISIQDNDLEKTNLLLEGGADLSLKTNEGLTPLSFALKQYGAKSEIVQLLKKHSHE